MINTSETYNYECPRSPTPTSSVRALGAGGVGARPAVAAAAAASASNIAPVNSEATWSTRDGGAGGPMSPAPLSAVRSKMGVAGMNTGGGEGNMTCPKAPLRMYLWEKQRRGHQPAGKSMQKH